MAMGFAALYPSYDMNMTSRSRGAITPEVCHKLPALFEMEGAGKTGCLLHPRSRVRFAQTKLHTSIQVQAGAFRPSLRNGFTAYFVLSPENGSFASVACKLAYRKLSASTAAPEPHDFAVRFRRVRLARPRVHRISPHVRDDRERPSIG